MRDTCQITWIKITRPFIFYVPPTLAMKDTCDQWPMKDTRDQIAK